MKKILILLLITSVTMVSAKTIESKINDNNKSKNSSSLLEKKTNTNQPIFNILGAGHTLPPVSCDPTVVTQNGCVCRGGRLMCYEK